jgi:hypothetical protein
METLKKLKSMPHFIALKMTDKVPFRTGNGHRLLPCRLLNLVLSYNAKPSLPGFAYDIGAMRLGDGDYLDF